MNICHFRLIFFGLVVHDLVVLDLLARDLLVFETRTSSSSRTLYIIRRRRFTLFRTERPIRILNLVNCPTCTCKEEPT